MKEKEMIGTSGLVFDEPLIFEKSSKKRDAFSLTSCDVPEENIEELLPEGLCRNEIEGFPEVSEVDVMRHFVRLSQWNYGVDLGFYPLGSCTMKYNPKINEDVSGFHGFSQLHPYAPEELSQGSLELMYEMEQFLKNISGMDRITLQPAAGAQGELSGLMMIKEYLKSRGNPRKKVIIPDSAHGTNPASATLCGYKSIVVKSDNRGCIDLNELSRMIDEDVAAIMLTNPNTLGLFERDILKISDIIHKNGAMVYCDGANLNALMGIVKYGDMGIDVVHINLHKTFSTPHGGGGPGAGPVGIKKHLAPFMPRPAVEKDGERFYLNYDMPHSIGKIRSFYGNFAIIVRAYAYIRSMGGDGLKRASEVAVINANYIMSKLKEYYDLPYNKTCKHECVFSDKLQNQYGVTTLDIAKRLMDFGFHPPTIYFPLIVKGAIMIEPTETESKESLDEFICAMQAIAREARDNPDKLKNAPHKPKVSRLDETAAAKKPVLRWKG